MADGLGSPFAYQESNLFTVSKYTPPVLGICQFYFLNILTLLAPTQSADNMFHSFTVLCKNEKFLISSLHCF